MSRKKSRRKQLGSDLSFWKQCQLTWYRVAARPTRPNRSCRIAAADRPPTGDPRPPAGDPRR
eukprot:177471-Prorocentrum_minimum.AAC.8